LFSLKTCSVIADALTTATNRLEFINARLANVHFIDRRRGASFRSPVKSRQADTLLGLRRAKKALAVVTCSVGLGLHVYRLVYCLLTVASCVVNVSKRYLSFRL